MTLPDSGHVVTAAGQASFETRPGSPHVLITLADGQHLYAAPELLVRQPDGEFWLDLPLKALREQLEPAAGAAPGTAWSSAGQPAEGGTVEAVVPLVQEEIVVGKREAVTGGVRLSKVVHERQEMVEATALREEVQVERVPVNEYVAEPLPPTVEGDQTIIPIYEEVIVVEKRLLLKEKWVITKQRHEQPHAELITRRAEEAVVERLPGDVER